MDKQTKLCFKNVAVCLGCIGKMLELKEFDKVALTELNKELFELVANIERDDS